MSLVHIQDYQKVSMLGQAWWLISVIPTFRRQGQEDPEFKASLGYTVRSYLQTKQNKTKNQEKHQNNKNQMCDK
jgi:hypothetical protein